MSSRLIVALILILLVAVLFYLVFDAEFSAKKAKSPNTDSAKPNKGDDDIVEPQLDDRSANGTELGSSLAKQQEQQLEPSNTKVAQENIRSQKNDKQQSIEKTEAVEAVSTNVPAENDKSNNSTSDQNQYPLLDETELQSMLDAADSSLEEELFEQVDLVEKSKVEKSAPTQPIPRSKPKSKPVLQPEAKPQPKPTPEPKPTPAPQPEPAPAPAPAPANKIAEPKKQVTTYKPIRAPIRIQSLEERQAKLAESSVEAVSQPKANTETDINMQPFEFVKQMDSVQLTLDLAQQYIDMGEYDSAKRLLQEVISGKGTAEQKSFAQSTLDGLY